MRSRVKQLLYLCIFLPLAMGITASQATELTISVSGNVDLSLQHYPANGSNLLIWVAAGNGLDQREIQLARELSQHGIEVWQIDFADALFQPHGNQLLRELNPDYLADLISIAHDRTGKQITLATHAYGAIAVINGIHRWQSRRPAKPYLQGAVLFTPELYLGPPELGQYPEYVAATYATRVPLFIIQDGKHHTRWQLPRLLHTLQRSGATVYVKQLRNVTGLFYSSDDSSATVSALFDLPTTIQQAIPLLGTVTVPLHAAPLRQQQSTVNKGLNTRLVAFKGNVNPPAIELNDINHRHFQSSDYHGKVTIVNFWATWCPPCVEEIPSLNRLRRLLKKEKFELISINYAEDPQRIHAFMHQVNVEYPVLIDPEGRAAAQWKVYVFPSTFVIGADGKIYYGVNAAIPWDSPEVVDQIRTLLPPH